MRTIFVGNPGTGKSTLLNGIIGGDKAKFASGVSYGEGLTTELQWVQDTETDYWYGDTPGLSDVKLREQAAKQITAALKTAEDDYKIVFILTEEEGRVRPVDITTITTVLRAIVDGGAATSPSYGIVVNKITKKKINTLCTDKKKMQAFSACLQNPDYPTGHIHLYGKKEELEDENDMIHTIDPGLTKFLKELPSMVIKPTQVQDVKVNDYEADNAKLELALTQIIEDSKLQQEKYKEDQIKIQQQLHMEIAENERLREEEKRKNEHNEEVRSLRMSQMVDKMNSESKLEAARMRESFAKEKAEMMKEQAREKKKAAERDGQLRGLIEKSQRQPTQAREKNAGEKIVDGLVSVLSPWTW